MLDVCQILTESHAIAQKSMRLFAELMEKLMETNVKQDVHR
jgi:hypothetical protein